MLLEAKANIDLVTDSGFSALALACKGGFDGCALVILNEGPSLESADAANGNTALLWAVDKCSSTTVKTL